ncbi:homoserine dehydrogenase [Thermicanus aegyptius]|uniref:homoserine dehydrogenase n=1 Tax=Thermicanus aegyptius TaxID=94009 RepID=UPI00040FCC98|nr:homoserine dehydrogenase [Thermicanus aegyptius]
MTKGEKVKIGLMGLGTVGTGVVRLLRAHEAELMAQTGMRLEIARILVKHPEKERSIYVPPHLLTADPEELLEDESIHVIVEVIGGIEPTRTYIEKALKKGKHVVTANKDLMALYGAELLKLAAEKNCDLFYEASVAGGIPIIRTLVESFTADRITKIMGIVNGTTNYILSKMTEEGISYEEALSEAKALGYAEADPTNDVEGYDAARKMAILATLGFHVGIHLEDVAVEGITHVEKTDINYADALGYVIKLLGVAEREEELTEVSVQPTLVPKSHPLASVSDSYNAVYVYGEAVGETMFYGKGAGELPTATAVVADLVAVVKNMKLGVNGREQVFPYHKKKMKEEDQIFTRFYFRFTVKDQAGVLAKITNILSQSEVSIAQIAQYPNQETQEAEILIVTHHASKKQVNQAIQTIGGMEEVKKAHSLFRVLKV